MSYLLHVYDLDLTIIVLNVAQSVGSGVRSNVRRTVVPNKEMRGHMYEYLFTKCIAIKQFTLLIN